MTGDRELMVTLGGAALRIGGGVTWRHIARLARLKLIPFEQADHIRLVRVADLPVIRQACIAAGYLRSEEAARA